MSKKTIVILTSVLSAILVISLIVSLTRPVAVDVKLSTPIAVRQNAPSASSSAQPVAATAPQTAAAPAQDEPDPVPAAPAQAQATQETAQQSDGAMSKEQIVELYNTAVNKVKKEAASLTRNYKHVSAPESQLELPSAIQGIGKTAIGTFVKGTDAPESWTSKEDMQIVFPVGNTDYSSHLTADMVETATCEDTGSAYKITIKLYDDKLTSPAKGEGYAGVFNTVTASTFSEINIPTVTFNRVDINGVGGSISCTVDKATQRVTEITFTETDILKLEVKVLISTLNVKLALATEENYAVTY
ncbi:MAG: hypothetical protein IJK89_11425 [Clostridia bacterium]|nr:hypothetical protein [Clostridia bacterium]